MPLVHRHHTATAPSTPHHHHTLRTTGHCPRHAGHCCACLLRHRSPLASRPLHALGVLQRPSGCRAQKPEHAQPSPRRIVIAHAQQVFLCVSSRPELTLCCSASTHSTAQCLLGQVDVCPLTPPARHARHSCRPRRATAGRSAVMAVVGRRVWQSGMCSTAVCSRAETGDAKP